VPAGFNFAAASYSAIDIGAPEGFVAEAAVGAVGAGALSSFFACAAN